MNLIFQTLKIFQVKYRLLYTSFIFIGFFKYLLELLTLGSLLPLIAIISDGDSFINSKFGQPINKVLIYLGYDLDNQSIVNLVIFGFFVLFFIRTIFGIFCIFFENNIKIKLVVNAQSKFLDYFNNTDDDHQETNRFSSFIRTATTDVDRMVEYTISHFQAILEILFVISILFILSKVSLNITLISFSVLFILISLTVLLTKNSLKNIAEKRQYYEKKLLK